ncbi:hypothetical protein Syun_028987 [Stephania yunnanensis]|uniref:Uncharacterized protein n=1 Tax=Stephania yunnanensis TaxID=152371 RepID=A0AAP0HFM4_9MAGN
MPMGNYIPISPRRDDVCRFCIQEGNGMESQEMLLPYKQLCSEKKETDRLRQVIEKEMLKVETLMVECGDRHYKFDVVLKNISRLFD